MARRTSKKRAGDQQMVQCPRTGFSAKGGQGRAAANMTLFQVRGQNVFQKRRDATLLTFQVHLFQDA